MYKYLRNLLIFIFLILIFQSCKKKEDSTSNCPYYITVPARYLTAPDSVKKDSLITVNVIPDIFEKCQRFFSFLSNTTNNVETIIMQTKVDTCNCPNQLYPASFDYNYYAPSVPGYSIIKVQSNNGFFLVDTIVVY